ncbi:MAG TPA: polysaccharide deacetylase family protein [Rhizomicrobium sp.]|nr:polysaccharide deacetylase family protein [Rhizomicrobium sp.]
MKTLAQKLGYGADERLLILNCDDLGSSHSANVAIDDSIRNGIGTSATLMVPCPWAREAVDMCGDLDIGVHLTLTAEYPGYRWRSLSGAKSLHDADGFMPRTAAEVWQNARIEDVEAECRAQIELALQWGVDVTHLDAHMGTMQINPAYYAVYLKLASECHLPLRMLNAKMDERLDFGCRATADGAGVLYPDDFAFQWGEPTERLLPKFLDRPEPGVSEFILHPVVDGPELRGYDKTEAGIRVGDYAAAKNNALRDLIAAQGIKLVSFRPLREAMRA